MTEVSTAPAAPAAPAVPAPPGAQPPASPDVAMQRAQEWATEYVSSLNEGVQSYLKYRRPKPISHAAPGPISHDMNGAPGLRPAIGEPTTDTGGVYVAIDVAMTSPIQFGGPPPYQPSKIIRSGELAFVVAVIWTNPVADCSRGWCVSAGVQLSAQPYRLTLDQMNLTSVTSAGHLVGTGVFGSPAAPFSFWVFPLPSPPPPGPNPTLIEANLTLDLTGPADLPYAAFATNFLDLDLDPGFPGVPGTLPGWRHEKPNRYLIYHS